MGKRTELARQLLKGGFGSLLAKIAEVGLGLLVSILLARTLGAGGYGTYAFVFALVSLVSVFVRMGVPPLVVRETARGQAAGEWAVVRGIWRWANIVVLGGALLAMSIGMTGLLMGWVRGEALRETLFWGLWLLPVMALAGVRSACLRGMHHVLAGVWPEQVLRPAILILLLLGLMGWSHRASFSSADAMKMMVVAAMVSFIVGIWLLQRFRPSEVVNIRPVYLPGAWLAGAWPMALTQGVDQLNRNVDVLFLGLLVATSDVGVYRVAAQGGLIASIGSVALSMAAAPFAARLHVSREHQKLQKLARHTAQAALAFAAMTTVGFAVMGGWLLTTLFGTEFDAAYWPLLILACGQMFSAGFGMNGMLLNMTGHERDVLRVLVVSVALNSLLNLVLIPYWGAVGASVATSVSMIFWNIWLWRKVRQRLGVRSTAF